MKKTLNKAVGLILSVSLAASIALSGCGNSNKANELAKASGSDPAKTAVEQLKPVKLSWYLRPTEQKDLSLVVEGMNKIIKEKINAELEIRRIDPGMYAEKLRTVVAAGEEFDLCLTTGNYDYSGMVIKGAFLPLDDLLKTYAPKTLSQVPDNLWDAARIKGKIYSVLNYQIAAKSYGMFVQKSMLDKYDFKLKDVKKMEDLEPLFEKLKTGESADKTIYGLYKGSYFSQWCTEINIEDDVSFESGKVKIINKYENPAYKSYIDLMRKWYQKGYINQDAATATNYREVRSTGKVLTNWSDFKPGCIPEVEKMMGNVKLDYVELAKPYVSTANVQSTMTAVSQTSKNPERAMMLLELVNTDYKGLYNMLCFGVEDKHYKKVAEKRIEPIANSGYAPNVSWMFGNQFNAYFIPGQENGVWEETIKLNESAKKSPIMGFTFDKEPVKAEIAQCKAIEEEYIPGIETGFVDPNKYLPEMIEKLKKAGLEKIMAEKQKQIDEWLKTKKK